MRPIAITMGDPCGIGPEICAKLFAEGLPEPAFIIGDAGVLERSIKALGLKLKVLQITGPSQCETGSGVISVLSLSNLPVDLPIGHIDARAGQAAYEYVVKAIELANEGVIGAIVTAPIAKEAMKAAGIAYPGHTEILADKSGTSNFAMMLANDELRSILVTIHVSLAEAIRLVTEERVLRTIRLAHQACRAYGIAKPRVAVAGLNPHAGEAGMFGREDIVEIAPAIAAAQAEGIDATGPWPGDTVFMRARRGDFDIVVAQYHDQGLIPVKYLGIEHGVNVTIGLPFVRTSVDHGTAFAIAGRGKADHSSLRYAFDQALILTRHKEADLASSAPDFIFMLTNKDRTIPDAMERLEEVVAAGIRHIGLKDVGLPFDQLEKIAAVIRATGARLYLEVVSLDAESERRSAEVAVQLGVDVLMGGTRPEMVLPVIEGTGICYYPFPGEIVGYPSVLKGTIENIVVSARALAAMPGVHGLDLLAYRFEGDVPRLIREVCAAVDKPVVVAGSIDRQERLQAVIAGKAAGFTIGTAALDGVFPARSKALPDQLTAIQGLLSHAGSVADQKRNSFSSDAQPDAAKPSMPMPDAATDTYERLIALLDEHKATYRLIDHPPEGRTDLVSPMRGHDAKDAAKCMIVMVKIGKKLTRFVLAVVPGDKRVNIKAVQSLYNGTFARFAETSVAERLSGSVSGTILPFSFTSDLQVVVDPGLLQSGTIYFNAARLDRSIALRAKDYEAIAQPRLAAIASN